MLVVSACGDKEDEAEETQTPEPVEISEEELVDDKEVVATVNETEILGSQYNPAYRERKELENFNVESAKDIETDKVKEITLEGLIGQELINQESKKLDIEVTDEEVQEEVEILESQEGDVLASLLEQFDWTQEDLEAQIRQDLTNNRYIEKTIDVEVTDEEAKKEYERVKEETEDKETVPDYDEVADNVKLQMTQQKQNEELQKHIDKFKEEADIETLI
ncbi:MAG TPA: SurA N-terminal domain-containing protein [Alloiococcus sp.]|nr:SurA N-terminal domain-containing protein [Alloiococcus sp.]